MNCFRRIIVCGLTVAIVFVYGLSQAGEGEERIDVDLYKSLYDAPPVEYIRSDIPKAKVPEATGKYYESFVPDTCNLSERIRLFVENYVSQITVPALDYEPYSRIYFNVDPRRARLDFGSYVCAWAKYRESLPLARIMSGSAKSLEIDQVWANNLLKCIGPDGLFYIPHNSRSWDSITPADYGDFFEENSIDHYAFLSTGNGRLLDTLAIYYSMTGDETWNRTARGIVDRMNELAVWVDDKAFFTRYLLRPNEVMSQEEIDNALASMLELSEQETVDNKPLWHTWIIIGLAKYYGVSGYEPARELAQGLTNFMKETKYIENWNSHFHCISLGIDAALELAKVTGNMELARYGQRSYDVAKSGKRSISIPELGYFVNSKGREHMESCTVADMTAIAVKLAQLGCGDQYWEDVDRYTRNCLVDNQVTDARHIEELFRRMEENGLVTPEPVKYYHLADNISQRMVGAWMTQTLPNEMGEWHRLVTCCTGNCSRALYYAWDSILDYNQSRKELKINLLLNRASIWADIDSYIPYTGRVDIKVKKSAKSVKVRMNNWIEKNAVSCKVKGRERSFGWEGNYLVLGKVKSGQTITVEFPIHERTVKLESFGHSYTAIFKGNECVDISPRGKNYPRFQRDHYRDNQPRYIKVKRFACDNNI